MSWTDFYDALARLEPDEGLASGRAGGLESGVADRVADDIAARLDLRPGHSLLDVGAGTGLLTRRLARRVARTVAVDPAPAAVKRGSAKADGIEWHVADAAAVVGGEADVALSFDRVLSYFTAHMFSTYTDLRDHIESLAGAVSPGGLILLGDVPETERTRQWETGERGRDENRTVWVNRLERRAIEMERQSRSFARYVERLGGLKIEPPDGFGEHLRGFDSAVVERICRDLGGCVSARARPLDLPHAHTSIDYVIRVAT